MAVNAKVKELPARRAAPARTVLFLCVALVCCGAAARGAQRPPLTFSRADSVLVVAPHPDDEVLCCAGILQRAAAAGARVAIVWVTGGDAFELDARLVEHRLMPGREGLLQLGMRRAAEALEAATKLGVPEAGRYLLGYPDRGLLHLALDNYYVRYRSPFTGADRVFLPGALTPGAPYEGQSLVKDLRAVIDTQQPTHVFVASPLDAHPDHRYSGELVIRLMGERGQLDRVYYWIVHAGLEWPRPRGLHLDRHLVPPRHARDLDWISFPLSPAEERVKLEALHAHRSQVEIMRAFLESFVAENEIFMRAAALPSAPAPSLFPNSSIIETPEREENLP